MDLLRWQALLARLYTEPALRKQLFETPQEFAQTWEISPEELEALQELSAREVEMFSHILARKRAAMVQKLLAATSRVIPSQFDGFFATFARQSLPKGTRKHQEDALAFARYLLEQSAQMEHCPPWLHDAIHYDICCIQAQFPEIRWQYHFFSYPIQDILKATQTSPPPAPNELSFSKKRNLIVWHRLRKDGRLRIWMWPRPSRKRS